jgi:hypothetical protein
MKSLRLTKWLVLTTTLILIFGSCLYCGLELHKFRQTKYNLSEETPEEIFQSRFMNGESIPSEVTEINAVEIYGSGGWEALARFKATDTFITEMLETDYGFEGIYSKEWPCRHVFTDPNFIAKLPGELEWWQPFNVTSKACYHAYTCTVHDEKFLLVDLDNNVVYFYRQNCGLCPSGEEEMAPLKPWCQQYWDNYPP